jgi:beta-phosphoglucomutase
MKNLADEKNNHYLKMLDHMAPEDTLPGILELLKELKSEGIKTAIYSASRNTDSILARLKLTEHFDTVITGNDVTKAKPDPEGFLLAAERLSVQPQDCLVVEDAFAGIEAAVRSDMKTMGIGQKLDLYNADYVLPNTSFLSLDKLNTLF